MVRAPLPMRDVRDADQDLLHEGALGRDASALASHFARLLMLREPQARLGAQHRGLGRPQVIVAGALLARSKGALSCNSLASVLGRHG